MFFVAFRHKMKNISGFCEALTQDSIFKKPLLTSLELLANLEGFWEGNYSVYQ